MADEASRLETPCSLRGAFCLGGLGALAPIVLNLAVVDATALAIDFRPAVLLGYAIRVAALFLIGALGAYLHRETNRARAFQLGIAAPALLTGWINGQNVSATLPPKLEPRHGALEIGLVTNAYAQDARDDVQRESEGAEAARRDSQREADEKRRSDSESFREGVLRGILGRPSESALEHRDDARQH
jgi:hypothetical protein